MKLLKHEEVALAGAACYIPACRTQEALGIRLQIKKVLKLSGRNMHAHLFHVSSAT